jgi:CheY-like chemotaxis protein
MIRIVVVDDQALVRAGLRLIVESEPGMEVVGEAANGEEALAVIAASRPDVVLMDVRMPGIDGLEATRRLSTEQADPPPVLILTTFDDDGVLWEPSTPALITWGRSSTAAATSAAMSSASNAWRTLDAIRTTSRKTAATYWSTATALRVVAWVSVIGQLLTGARIR